MEGHLLKRSLFLPVVFSLDHKEMLMLQFVIQRNVFGATQEMLIQLEVSNDDWLMPVKGPQYPM